MDERIDAAPAPSLGATLAQERERQGLSRAEVAQRLHMSPSQVEALEGDEHDRLPKGTFLRGFVRNYAKLLGADPDAAVAMLASVVPAPAPRIVVPSQNIRFGDERLANSPYVKAGMLAMVVVALGFAGMYWWLFVRPTPPAVAQKAPDMPPPQQIAAPPAQVAATPSEPPPAPVEAPKAAEPLPEPAPAPARAESRAPAVTPASAVRAADAARVAAGAPSLKFRFRGDSWVEVKDGAGKVLVSRLNTKGSEAEISGKPPLTVTVGNAPDVTLLVNDREFPLEPHTRVAVARFTVE